MGSGKGSLREPRQAAGEPLAGPARRSAGQFRDQAGMVLMNRSAFSRASWGNSPSCHASIQSAILAARRSVSRSISLVPTPWRSQDGTSLRELENDELAGGRGRGMNGTHRPNGIFIANGFGKLPDSDASGFSLVDVAPTVLAAMGLPAGPDFDGDALGAEHREYTAEEEAVVAARLRAMGYLE